MTEKKLGGARPGAGRPKAGRKGYELRIKPGSMKALRCEAARRGVAHIGVVLEQDYPEDERGES